MNLRLVFVLLSLVISITVFGQSSALVVVDMQSYFSKRYGDPETGPVGNKKKLEKVIEEQIAAIKLARKNNVPIIFVEYDIPEVEGTLPKLLKQVKDYEKTISVVKKSDGLFDTEVVEGTNWAKSDYIAKPPFNITERLKQWNIDSLVLIGANGGACVQQSICGALRNDFKIVTYGEAVIDFNYENFVYPYYYSKDEYFAKSLKQITERSDLKLYFNGCNRNLMDPNNLF